MPAQALSIAGWTVFAFLVGCCGYLALAACDLGIRPLFALGYCSVHAAPDGLADQRARERGLLDRIHEAELHLARLPVCAPPPPPSESKKEARVVTPAPQPTPTPQPTPAPGASPTPEPSPTETPQPPEQLKIPKNLSELKGCWQSEQGDLAMKDDHGNPTGEVRLCYCFGNNGRGSARAVWSNGVRCQGPLQARIYSERLVMRHQSLKCSDDYYDIYPGEIECKGTTEENSTTCTWRTARSTSNESEKYQRVPPEHCN
jgi:hypothetical protein